jgi:hypothetical protein
VEEEEQRKKDEEARNSETIPMDTNIPEISTTNANGHAQFIGLSLGLHTPFMSNDVPSLRKIVYDKASSMIVQEREKKILLTREPDFIDYIEPHNGICHRGSSIHSLS